MQGDAYSYMYLHVCEYMYLWLNGHINLNPAGSVLMARYNVSEAARKLGVSKDTLLRWERLKKIPAAPRLRRSGHRVYDDALISKIEKDFASPIVPAKVFRDLHRK